MADLKPGFSPDRRWWWNGERWMPATSPDGGAARWDGRRWRMPARSAGRYALVALGAVGLWLVEVGWVALGLVILVFQANEEWYARGQVGTESVGTTSISVPMFASFAVLPLAITFLVSRLIPRRWWIGLLAGGGPALVAIAWGVWPSALLEVAVLVPSALAFVAIAWWAGRQAPLWRLSADGASWTDGKRSHSAVSSDGLWGWNGEEWVAAAAPPVAGQEPGPTV